MSFLIPTELQQLCPAYLQSFSSDRRVNTLFPCHSLSQVTQNTQMAAMVYRLEAFLVSPQRRHFPLSTKTYKITEPKDAKERDEYPHTGHGNDSKHHHAYSCLLISIETGESKVQGPLL